MKAIMEVGGVALELKYCERCGSLWLREEGAEEVFCEACVSKLSARPGYRFRTGRQGNVNQDLDLEGLGEGLALICGEGGHA